METLEHQPPPPPPPTPPKRRKLPSLRSAIAPQGMLLSRDARRKKPPPCPEPAGGVIAKDSSSPSPSLAERMTRKASSSAQPLVPWARRKTSDEKKISIPAKGDHKAEHKADHKADLPDVPGPHGPAAPREGRQFAVANVRNRGRIYLRPTVRPTQPQPQPQPQPQQQHRHRQQRQQQYQHQDSQTDLTLPVTPPGPLGAAAIDHDKLLPLLDPDYHGNRYTPTTSRSSTAIAATSQPLEPLDSDHPRYMKPRPRAMSESTMHTTNESDADAGDAGRLAVAVPELDSGNGEGPRTSDEPPSPSSTTLTGGAPLLNIDIPSWRLGSPRFTIGGTPLIRGSSYAPSEDSRSSGASLWNRARGNRTGAMPNVGPNRLSHLASPHARFSLSSQSHSLRLLRPPRPCASTDLVIEPAMFTDLTFKPACDEHKTVRYSTSGTVTAATAPRLVAEITSPSFLDYELISDFFLTFRSFLEPELLLQMLIARLRWALARVDETGMIVRVRAFVAIRHWILNYFIDDFILDYGLRTTFCTLLNDFVDEVARDAKDRKVQLEIVGELKKCWRRICAYYWDGPDFAHSLGVEAPIAPGGILGNRDPTLDPTTPNMRSSSNSQPQPRSVPGKPSAGVPRKPKTPVSKRGHLRNDSISGSRLRPDLGDPPGDGCNFTTILQAAGRLVRGDLLPPGQPFVDIKPDNRPRTSDRRATTIPSKSRSSSHEQQQAIPGTTSGYGVKKLFESVKRALNVRDRDPWLSSQQSTCAAQAQHQKDNQGNQGNQGIVIDGLPNSRRDGTRHPFRIDLLGAEIAEDFKKALREEDRTSLLIPPKTAPAYSGPPDYSVANMDSSLFDGPLENRRQRPASDMPMLLGNKMSTIIDGTSWFEISGSERAAPSLSSFDHALACSFVPTSGGAPFTPPATPFTQGQIGRPPRQSSRSFLDPNVHEGRPDSPDPLFSTQTALQGGLYNLPSSEGTSRASLLPPQTRQHLPPPISGGLLRMQKKNGVLGGSHQPAHATIRKQASFVGRVGRRSAASSMDDDFDAHEAVLQFPFPPRRLGGDSPAVLNLDDLEVPVLRTSQSAATLTTCTESIRGSYLLGAFPSTNPQIQVAADGTLPGERDSVLFHHLEDPVKHKLPMIQAPSSTPVMPPYGDDQDIGWDEDDGGIESALLKLEGKYRPGRMGSLTRKPQAVVAGPEDLHETQVNFASLFAGTGPEINVESVPMKPHERALWLLEGGARSNPVSTMDGRLSDAGSRPPLKAPSLLSVSSHVSYCSDKHGNHGLHTGHSPSKRPFTIWTDKSVLQFSHDDDSDIGDKGVSRDEATDSGQMSYFFDEEESNLERSRVGRRTSSMGAGCQTFLDDASDANVGVSSDLDHDGNQHGNPDDMEAAALLNLPWPTRRRSKPPPRPYEDPLTISCSTSPPDPMTDPMNMAHALEMGLERELFPEQIWASKPLPGTPTFSCVEPFTNFPSSSSYYGSPTVSAFPPSRDREYEKYRQFSIHLPFILAFDAEVLAQQFTLIEKDALGDIDWKDLIEMNWKDSTTSDPRSWVEYLKNSEAFGVEVVIARFNLMVKWAISEIVLTQHIKERAKCVTKFIHVAAQCRSYRNFATMAQLTIALTSNEISRLSKTWDLVPEEDRTMLKKLEKLVTPTRNFYNLRAEMEIGSDSGCIPFVGIYTHDLLYTAQRPSELANCPDAPPLINFERFRIVASIVKTLLRLLEASTRYAFQPVEGITERCLWMSALNDDEIRRHCRHLE